MQEKYQKIIEEKMSQGIRCITRHEQVEHLRPRILRKIAKSFYIYSLSFFENGTCLLDHLMVTPNRQYEDLPILEDEWMSLQDDLCDRHPFMTYALLNVEVEAEKALASLYDEIYMKCAGKNTYFFQINANDEFVDICNKNHKIDYSEIFNDDDTLRDDIVIFNSKEIGGQTCTNGQLKQRNITLPACNMGDKFNASRSWDKVTYGAVEISTESVESVAPKAIAQANTRFAAYKAPSAPVGEVKTFAVYMGKIKYRNSEDEYRDGFAFLSSEYMADILNELEPEKYWFAPWACDGTGWQCRPWSNKVLAECVSRAYINEFIKHKGHVKVILIRDKITSLQQNLFNLAVKGKGPWAGKTVIISDSHERASDIDFFTDLNGMKTTFDIRRKSNLEVLDLTHEEHDVAHGSNLSTQLVQSLMVINPEKTVSIIEHHVDRLIKSKINTLTSTIGHAPSSMDLDNNAGIIQMLTKTAPQFANSVYAPLWHGEVDNALKGYVRSARKLNLPTAGCYLKIVMDAAADFDFRVLGPTENGRMSVYSPYLYKLGYRKIILVKYPKMHYQEYLVADVLGYEQYCEKVDNTNMSDYQKKLVKSHAKHLSGGMIMLPAFALLKNQLAGMDIDGDAVQAFVEEEVTDTMDEGRTLAVVIDEKDVPTEEDLAMGA